MSGHRLHGVLEPVPSREPVLASSCGGFVACPMLVGHHGTMTQALLWQQVYAWALEQARAAAVPSRFERLQTLQLN